MDPLLAVIVVLSLVFFGVAVYMGWLGLVSIVTFRSGHRHPGCGHLKLTPANDREACWHCRHRRLDRALHSVHH